jgi:aspartokinase/homoserine dehydrogenase 2
MTVINVHKFGGSSLADKTSFLRVSDIIKNNHVKGDWIIVSAAGKATNKLIEIAESSIKDKVISKVLLQELKDYQLALIDVLSESNAVQMKIELEQDINLLNDYIEQAEYSVLQQAKWVCFGEIWSSRLLAGLLNSKGLEAIAVDARTIIRSQGMQVDLFNSAIRIEESGLLKRTGIKIVTGFIAADSKNNTQTLGRNGSDYSASLFAKLLEAKQVVFWTDVSGVYSADPRIVKSALPFEKLHWSVANILAQSGNPVLHSKTVTILSTSDCEIMIKNSLLPEVRGTKIVKEDFVYTPFVSRASGYGLMCASKLELVDMDHIAFEFSTNDGQRILIKDEFIILYQHEKLDYQLVDFVLVFGCETKFNDTLRCHAIDTLHIHKFHDDYRFFITENKFSDELYQVFHDVMCLESDKKQFDYVS